MSLIGLSAAHCTADTYLVYLMCVIPQRFLFFNCTMPYHTTPDTIRCITCVTIENKKKHIGNISLINYNINIITNNFVAA